MKINLLIATLLLMTGIVTFAHEYELPHCGPTCAGTCAWSDCDTCPINTGGCFSGALGACTCK